MAMKKKISSKEVAPLPDANEGLRYLGIVIEEVRAQQQVMLEAMSSMREHFDAQMEERFGRVDQRLDVLESVVRDNSRDIQKNSEDIQKNSEDIQKNSEDIQKNSEDIRKNSEDIRKNSEDIVVLQIEVRRLRVDFDAHAKVC